LGAGTAWFCLSQCAIPFCTLSAGACKKKTRSRGKALRGGGATMGRAESEKKGKGGRKEEIGGGIAETSRGGVMT